MKVVVLASGSKGNCTYIETEQGAILLDAGISLLQIRMRLAQEGIEISKISAVFVSHEHSDHIHYLANVLDRFQCPVYIQEDTYELANKKLSGALSTYPKVFIHEDTRYVVNDLLVVPAKLSHDSVNVFGFLIKQLSLKTNATFASITDTGILPARYFDILSTIQVLMIESNHDIKMLEDSNRPWYLIERILSDQGHMSNVYCDKMLKQIVSKYTKQVILAHISEECNTYELAKEECEKAFEHNLPFELKVAKQKEPLPMIEVQ
jgi:phosphoribosyl 1,2-cyclic phosphodiesterase